MFTLIVHFPGSPPPTIENKDFTHEHISLLLKTQITAKNEPKNEPKNCYTFYSLD